MEATSRQAMDGNREMLHHCWGNEGVHLKLKLRGTDTGVERVFLHFLDLDGATLLHQSAHSVTTWRVNPEPVQGRVGICNWLSKNHQRQCRQCHEWRARLQALLPVPRPCCSLLAVQGYSYCEVPALGKVCSTPSPARRCL